LSQVVFYLVRLLVEVLIN